MKRLFAMILCLALCLSLAACGGSDKQGASSDASSNTSGPTEDTGKPNQPNKTPKPTKPAKPEETQPAPTKHTHNYTKTVVAPTCGAEGYTRYKCSCGDQYQENYTPQTYDHIFKEGSKTLGGISYSTFICKNCDTEAYEHVGYDASGSANPPNYRYYITYTPKAFKDYVGFENYHLVVTGSGQMMNFKEDRIYPGWYPHLEYVEKITVTGNLTSISEGAFVFPNSKKVEFEISGSVQTIQSNAVNMNISTLILGKGVESIKGRIYVGENLQNVYLPKSLKYFQYFGSGWDVFNTSIYYEGSKEEFLSIKRMVDNEKMTIKDYLQTVHANDVSFSIWRLVYVNASKVGDTKQYFDLHQAWKSWQ